MWFKGLRTVESAYVAIHIVDKGSIVDVMLMANQLRALPPKAGLLLVGNIDQLPSVRPGMVFRM
jgi:exodeoxyribonuclease V alpha subunit